MLLYFARVMLVALGVATILVAFTGCASRPAPASFHAPGGTLMFKSGIQTACEKGITEDTAAGRVLCHVTDGVVSFRAEDIIAVKYLDAPVTLPAPPKKKPAAF